MTGESAAIVMESLSLGSAAATLYIPPSPGGRTVCNPCQSRNGTRSVEADLVHFVLLDEIPVDFMMFPPR